MKIKKIYQGELPENKILNAQSTSQTDTYSCDYINNLGVGGGENIDELPIGTRVEFNGETIPDGWEQVEESGKNIITAYSTQNVEMASGESLIFDNATILGEKFILENGKIKIGSGVSKVKVSGQIWYYANTTTRQWFVLNQNTNISNQMIAYNNNYNVMAFTPKIIDVKEGDEFYFSLHNIEGTGKVIVNNGASPKIMTYITIEEVSNVVNSVVEEVSNDNVYSTEETIVGTFLGKPLYRKVVVTNIGIGGTDKDFYDVEFDVNPTDIDLIWVDASSSFLYNVENSYTLVGGESGLKISVGVVVKKYIRFFCKTEWGTYWTKVISVLYTKTTD